MPFHIAFQFKRKILLTVDIVQSFVVVGWLLFVAILTASIERLISHCIVSKITVKLIINFIQSLKYKQLFTLVYYFVTIKCSCIGFSFVFINFLVKLIDKWELSKSLVWFFLEHYIIDVQLSPSWIIDTSIKSVFVGSLF